MQTVLLIGAMKCGTTSLFEWLARHPQICPTRVKEPEYFSRNQDHRLAVRTYDDLFDERSRARVRMEASTGYSKYPEEQEVPQRIAQELTNPKFIYLVRDPFQRIESHFNHLHGDLPYGFWQDMPQEPSLEEQFARYQRYHTDIVSGVYIDFSKYATQLERFAQVFGRDAILVLELNELQQHPTQVLQRCYEFLGLRPHWKDVVRRLRPRKYFFAYNRGENHTRERRRRLTAAERRIIATKLQADMLMLQQHYGVDIAQWGFPVSSPVISRCVG